MHDLVDVPILSLYLTLLKQSSYASTGSPGFIV